MAAPYVHTAFPAAYAVEEHLDIEVLREDFAALDPHVRSLAARTRAALSAFERSVPGDLTVDYANDFVTTGAAALHVAVADLADLLDDAVRDVYP